MFIKIPCAFQFLIKAQNVKINTPFAVQYQRIEFHFNEKFNH